MIDYGVLKQAIVEDPTGMGTVALLKAGLSTKDQGSLAKLADVYNSLSGPGAGTITRAFLPRAEFLLSIRSVFNTLAALATTAPELQAKWDRIFGWLLLLDQVPLDEQ